MNMKFSEYHKQYKERLLEDVDNVLEFNTIHTLTKYCKIPLIENNKKFYHSFKVNDTIEVLWERKQDEITPISIKINEMSYKSQWNNNKTKKWILSSTKQFIT